MHIESGNCPVANKDGQRRDEVKAKAPVEPSILDMGRYTSSSESDAPHSAVSSEDNEQEGGVRLDQTSAQARLATKPSLDFEPGGVSLPQPIPVYAPDSAHDERTPPFDPTEQGNTLEWMAQLDEMTPTLNSEATMPAHQQIPVYTAESFADGLNRRARATDRSVPLPLSMLYEHLYISPMTASTVSGHQPIRLCPAYDFHGGISPPADPNERPGLVMLSETVRRADVTASRAGDTDPNNPFASDFNYEGAGLSKHDLSVPGPSISSPHNLRNVDPQEFWNLEKGRFVCNCGVSFLTAREFSTHIILDDGGTIKDCPRCFKRFEKLAALVAHVEEPQSKCAIFADDHIDDEINEIPRGFATFRSHHDELDMDESLIDMGTTSEVQKITTATHAGEDKNLTEELRRLKFEEK
ncbi:hypothetical protein N7508_010460 [Penicillium antarcticum]|uniref:uncharacterized protein n=1 Tax=Penicillium antarcticum TaxID=416450 RepID=UPI00238D1255|nr:uncharacterized protein N7508_010460 [Penicillium antarcticum]KAJ5295639.1 hypothetical protein N7508_010460 [Penicillium antarcticum]